MSHEEQLHDEVRAIREDVAELRSATAFMREGIADLSGSMKQVAEAMVRLARLEERHGAISVTLDRLFDAQSGLDGRLSALEAAKPSQDDAAHWVRMAIGGVLGAAGVFLLRKLGIA